MRGGGPETNSQISPHPVIFHCHLDHHIPITFVGLLIYGDFICGGYLFMQIGPPFAAQQPVMFSAHAAPMVQPYYHPNGPQVCHILCFINYLQCYGSVTEF